MTQDVVCWVLGRKREMGKSRNKLHNRELHNLQHTLLLMVLYLPWLNIPQWAKISLLFRIQNHTETQHTP